jgi:transcription elongation GreA/GreB family factor
MARTADHDATSPATAGSRQRRPAQQQERAPQPQAAVVLTPEGHRRLAARAAWLATERIPRLAHNLDSPDQDGWAGGEYGRAVTELARLTSVLGQAITTEELPPERPGVVELGDEVMVEFDAAETERFLLVDPVEAPVDDVRISVQSPLAQALLGRRVGEQIEVEAPAGRYRCRILATGRHQPVAASTESRTSGSWVIGRRDGSCLSATPPGRSGMRATGRSPCSASAFQLRRFAWSTCRSACRRGDVHAERVLRYFRKVDRALREVLAGERAPMVLAAVEPLFLRAQRAAAARYDRLAGSGLTSKDPREIIRARIPGRSFGLPRMAVSRPSSPPGCRRARRA